MNWLDIQLNSTELLAEGLQHLRTCPRNTQAPASPGNYMIFEEDTPYYIGESTNIAHRLKGQLKADSTFARAFEKKIGRPPRLNKLSASWMTVAIGRKEIEEFGMGSMRLVNIFRSKKSLKTTINPSSSDNWLFLQCSAISLLKDGASELAKTTLLPWSKLIPLEGPGIYIIKNKNVLEYIGETSDLSERYYTHGGRTYFSAFRRSIGERLGFTYIGKKKFSDIHESQIDKIIGSMLIGHAPISIGRAELEELAIRTWSPTLNKKIIAEA